MRILMAPEGTRGDVQPLAVLGRALRERGCEVRVCAASDARPLVEQHGLGFCPVPLDVRAWIQSQAAAVHAGGLAMHRAAADYMSDALDHQLRALTREAEDADLILGGGVQIGAPTAAEAHGIPYRFVAYCPIVFPSGDHPPFIVERRVRSGRMNRWLWRAFLGVGGALLRPAVNRRREALGLAPVRDFYSYLRSPRPLLAADPQLAPLPDDVAFDVETVGFLAPPGEGRLPEKLESFLAAGPAPVYLGFGSMPDPDPARTTRQVLEAVRHLGVRAVVSEGWAGLGRAPLPEGVTTVGAVPHGLLFPRMAAIVHHGGAGTTSTAARAGVPQLVVPHLLDQFYWADRVERLGLGPPALPRRQLDAERLAGLLEVILGNDVLNERAAELAARMNDDDPVARAADAILRDLRPRA
jgi:vancomycin aglycone glucosyltransferase